MNKIKVSHEVPFCLLGDSLSFNDYQYALPHLLEENEQYRDHFLKCKENGVEIYLDNSLHELGYAMDDEILIKWMNILQPSTFFIPDAWEDKDTSEKMLRDGEILKYLKVL
jgi:predicted peroxiredoxin